MPIFPFSRCLAVLLLLLAGGPAALHAAESRITPERPAEMLVYQYPATDLVIRVDLPETGFAVRVFDPERALVKSSAVRGRRLGPVYHYIDGADLPRQLTIEVAPDRPVTRSALGIELIPFAPGDRNDAALGRAYRLFASGVETARSADAATWATKVYSLRNAARMFAELGRENLRLWSDYFAAHLALHELDDPLLAIEWAREIGPAAARAGFGDVELAALALEGDALLRQLGVGEGVVDSGGALPDGVVEKTHNVLDAIAVRAGAAGLRAEQGRALYHDGLLLERQGDTEHALERYQTALTALADAGDPELQSAVRGTAAAAYEALGSATGALAMLDPGNAPAGQAEQAALEQADRLYERGRLLNQTYRYAEAAEALGEALALQRTHAGAGQWGLTGLELAWSLFSMGREEETLATIEASFPRTPRQGHAETLARAWGMQADIQRVQGRHEAAARAREQQLQLLVADHSRGVPAALLEQGMDAFARGAAGADEARGRLQRARQAARSAGDDLSEARAELQLCALELERAPDADCRSGAAAAAARLRASGVPRFAAEAGLVHARLQARTDPAAASDEIERVLDEVQWYRRALPGVLGAWYALHAGELGQAVLELSRDSAAGQSATHLLLALDRLRGLDADSGTPTPLGAAGDAALRDLLARRDAAGGDAGRRLADEARQALADARRSCPACGEARAEEGWQERGTGDLEVLLAGLNRGEAVLAYYLGNEEAWAVLAGPDGAQRFDLATGRAQAVRLRDGVRDLRQPLAADGPAAMQRELDAIGRSLLAPLARRLPQRIYLLSTGSLRAIPFDTLRHDGRYLGQTKEVVNLSSLDSLRRRRPALPADFRERVFVAGNPQSQRDPFRFELNSTPELGAVTNRFVGPGLHVVQGVALGRDEFADPRFPGAALLHLAIPGVLDLAQPERSRLLLSVGADVPTAPAETRLAPGDVQAFDLDAALAVLTATAVANAGELAHAGRLPLVSDFLDAGVSAVLYTLWPVEETAAAAFADAFYERLENDPDISQALWTTRQAVFGADGAARSESNLADWAGFQLFIR